MGGGNRLSGLSDDLLAVISLLPTREAVRTAALSRRWRPVWLRAHSLVLDTRSYGGDHSENPWAYVGGDHGSHAKERLFFDACKLLDAAGRCSHVRNLSLSVHGRDKEYFKCAMGHSRWGSSRDDSYDLMASLLGASALRHLEEVHVKFGLIPRPHRQREELSGWLYKLDPAELPEHTLRVLDLEYCRLESPEDAAAVSFRRLSSIRLYKCSSSMEDLEGWISAAPGLGSVHIQDHNFYRQSDEARRDRFALQSPSLTALTLVSSSWSNREHFELDVPCLRTFKYSGSFEDFSMKSYTAKLERVDLAVDRILLRGNREEKNIRFPHFWQLMRNFGHVKTIKLKVASIEGIAVAKDVQHEHLFSLPGLERIELKGFSHPGSRDDAALAIANLLQCCPVLHDLRIRIPINPYRNHYADHTSAKVRVSDFDVSWMCSGGASRKRWFLSWPIKMMSVVPPRLPDSLV